MLCTVEQAFSGDDDTVQIIVDRQKPISTFYPEEVFGHGLDGLNEKQMAITYRKHNVQAMRQSPFMKLSYRLRTELANEAWHWNADGQWSDAAHQQGYWVSNWKADKPLLKSYGYRLPRRGNTIDQADNDSYSRIDDNNLETFWKSNPYVDTYYTHEDNSLYPQWVIVDMGQQVALTTIRIVWGEPYATSYTVQYWEGHEESHNIDDLTTGVWHNFTNGVVTDGKGGDVSLQLENTPKNIRYFRIILKSSSQSPVNTKDIRDRLGYAIREIYAGTEVAGTFHDLMQHGTSQSEQSTILVSSTDPWHRAVDRSSATVQPGFDLILASRLGRKRNILMPVPMVYDTPENAAAEIRFFQYRHFPVNQIELGEEPDGQNITPEHYGALYLQFTKAIHDIAPSIITGGPSLQTDVTGSSTFPNDQGEDGWMQRFIDYLKKHGRLHDFGFFSFEWYPFDNICKDPAEQLIQHTNMLKEYMENMVNEGVPTSIPWIISEYGFSSFLGRAEVELPGALINAEIVAQFLSLGGNTSYYYGLEPNDPGNEVECAGRSDNWGNLMLMQLGADNRVRWKLPAYYGAKMLVHDWAGRPDKEHQMYRTEVLEHNHNSSVLTAFTLRRPDKRLAIMILNKSKQKKKLTMVTLRNAQASTAAFRRNLDVVQYSPRQYAWHAQGEKSHPLFSKTPVTLHMRGGLQAGIILPPLSITVIRGSEGH